MLSTYLMSLQILQYLYSQANPWSQFSSQNAEATERDSEGNVIFYLYLENF